MPSSGLFNVKKAKLEQGGFGRIRWALSLLFKGENRIVITMDSVSISILSIALIFAATTLGSAFVFFFRKNFGPKINNVILGFAGGIMVAASFFGLLLPSIEQSKIYAASYAFVPPLVGFLLGGVLLYAMDKLIPHFHESSGEEEGPRNAAVSHNFKFFLAVTIHNIPEGLSVGFACGLALAANDSVLAFSALSLAIGIAIQNVPEGAAVSIPLFGEGMSKGKAFLFGTLSGLVEPIFAIAGLYLASLSLITPWLLSFAAGAMIYVTLDEILPSSREGGYEHYGLWAFMIGFAIMMVLELVL